MKKSISLFALVILIGIAFQSCCKRDMQPSVSKPVTTNVNTTLKENQSYQFSIPVATNGQPFNIVTQATHSSVSYINTDVSGNNIYQYTPAVNYTGEDFVSISNNSLNEVQPVCSNCNSGCHGGGSCGQHTCCHHQECAQQKTININFTITAPVKPTSNVNKEIASSN